MHVLLLVLLTLFSPAIVFAEPPDLFSFAASLAAENDHYRAITEYKRFLHYHPQDARAPQAQLAIAESLFAGQRWQQGDAAAEKVWLGYPDSPEALQARKRYASAASERGDNQLARERYQQLKELVESDHDQANYQIGLSYLKQQQLPEAEQSFAELPGPESENLRLMLDEYRQLPRKSPQLAGTLSALLPGAGQLYTERPKQAAVAFTLNAAFIYAAIEAWNNENYAVASILTMFEIGWYGGNIYNAANNAHKINQQRETEFIEQLQQRSGISLGFDGQTPWLQASFRF